MKKLLLYILFIPFLISCQEEVFIDLANTEPVPVIEAIWTNVGSINQVKVSLSRDYYDEVANQVVKDAVVHIRNTNTGQEVPFLFSEPAERYLPTRNFNGEIGEPYELSVRMGNKLYKSNGTMLAPPVFDSIQSNFKEERLLRREGYYLTIYGEIPFTEDNNYRIRIVRNDTLLNNRGDYLLFDDSFGTSILSRGLELNGYPFRENDRVRLELFRMNPDAFSYLNDLVTLLFNDGGLFSPPPQNPQSNIRVEEGGGEVVGYFMVSPYLTNTITITP